MLLKLSGFDAALSAGTLECCKKKAVEYSGIVLAGARLSKQVRQ